MIYTITFNPSLDYFVELDSKLTEGLIFKTDKTALRAGGKGINISIMLSMMGIPSKALLFLGGAIGNVIETELSKLSVIEIHKIKLNENNRINVKIKTNQETAINAYGPIAEKEHQLLLLKELESLEEKDIVVISGSFCRGIDSSFVEKIGVAVKSKKAKLVTDIPNLTAEDYSRICPTLIKPNLEELASIFKKEINLDNYRSYVKQLIDSGVESVIVSLGKDGSYYADKQNQYRVIGPEIQVVNTVGCGDSMLTYVIASLMKGLPLKECLKYGEAAGRAKAQHLELAMKETVEKMLDLIKVEKVI